MTIETDRIAELEDELKVRDRRLGELKAELDGQRDLVHRMSEHVTDARGVIDSWVEAFEMVLDDKGDWDWAPFIAIAEDYRDRYRALVRKWNKLVPDYNAVILKRNVGRPIEASEAQQAEILKRRKRGESLRGIAEEMSLGLRTVRTIVGKADGTDRTSAKHLQRIDPDRLREKAWEARTRTRAGLPKRINETLKAGAVLLKEAKGLGR